MINNEECPLCGGKKRKAAHLICATCYEKYAVEAGKTLAQKKKIVFVFEWAKEEIKKRFEQLQKELQEIKEEYRTLQGTVRNKAYLEIKKSLGRKIVPQEVFRAAMQQKKTEIWQTKKGNGLHRKLKITERQVNFLQGFLEGENEKSSSLEKDESSS